jgi:hypothetical protein
MLNAFISEGLKMLPFIRYITFSAYTFDNLMILYNAVFRSKLDYVSVASSPSLQLIHLNLKEFGDNLQPLAMLGGSHVTTAWRVLRLRMEETPSRFGGKLRTY